MLKSQSTTELVDACRSAALGFMASANGWTKRQLAEWLETVYLPLPIGIASEPQRQQIKLTPAWGTAVIKLVHSRRVESNALQDVVAHAHADVASTLRRISEQRAVMEFGEAMMHSALVVRCVDEEGTLGWAPAARTRMRLSERVLSLFAADFLTRPWDYECSLRVCAQCDSARMVDVDCCVRSSGSRRVTAPASRVA